MIYDFSDDEVNALGVLIDEALKATGVKHVTNAGILVAKLRAPYQVKGTSAPNGEGTGGAPQTAVADNDSATPDIPAGAPVANAA